MVSNYANLVAPELSAEEHERIFGNRFTENHFESMVDSFFEKMIEEMKKENNNTE